MRVRHAVLLVLLSISAPVAACGNGAFYGFELGYHLSGTDVYVGDDGGGSRAIGSYGIGYRWTGVHGPGTSYSVRIYHESEPFEPDRGQEVFKFGTEFLF